MSEARAIFEIHGRPSVYPDPKKEHYRRVLPLNEPHRIMRATEVLADDYAEHRQRDEDGHLVFMKDKRTMEAKILRGLFLWESAGETTWVFQDDVTSDGYEKHYRVSVEPGDES